MLQTRQAFPTLPRRTSPSREEYRPLRDKYTCKSSFSTTTGSRSIRARRHGPGSCWPRAGRLSSGDSPSRSSSRIGWSKRPQSTSTGSRSTQARRPPASRSSRKTTGKVVAAAEIEHRGRAIKASLKDRQAIRRGRRARKTRYRKPRFDNRTRREGWLPPSLESRVANVLTWVGRLLRLCPITAASQELVRFDLQKEQNPEIAGIEYQQGTLAGYELREYLLEKYDRTCAVLRQDRRAAPGRAHRPHEPGRDGPGLEPHPGRARRATGARATGPSRSS